MVGHQLSQWLEQLISSKYFQNRTHLFAPPTSESVKGNFNYSMSDYGFLPFGGIRTCKIYVFIYMCCGYLCREVVCTGPDAQMMMIYIFHK